jgi:hypothetical protein
LSATGPCSSRRDRGSSATGPCLLVDETSLHRGEPGSLAVEVVPLRHACEFLGVEAALPGHRFDSLREDPASQPRQGASLPEESGFDEHPSSPQRPESRSHAAGTAFHVRESGPVVVETGFHASPHPPGPPPRKQHFGRHHPWPGRGERETEGLSPWDGRP